MSRGGHRRQSKIFITARTSSPRVPHAHAEGLPVLNRGCADEWNSLPQRELALGELPAQWGRCVVLHFLRHREIRWVVATDGPLFWIVFRRRLLLRGVLDPHATAGCGIQNVIPLTVAVPGCSDHGLYGQDCDTALQRGRGMPVALPPVHDNILSGTAAQLPVGSIGSSGSATPGSWCICSLSSAESHTCAARGALLTPVSPILPVHWGLVGMGRDAWEYVHRWQGGRRLQGVPTCAPTGPACVYSPRPLACDESTQPLRHACHL